MNEHKSNPSEHKTETPNPQSNDTNSLSSTDPDLRVSQHNITSPYDLPESDPNSGRSSRSFTLHSGPVPSAEELQQYARVNKSFPERIIAMAESESAHRRAQENTRLEANIQANNNDQKLARRGQWIALILSIVFLIAGVWLTLAGHPAVGGTIAGATLVSLVAIFITGRYSNLRTR